MAQELNPPDVAIQPLTPPEPALPVSQDDAGAMVKLDDKTTQDLDAKVREFIEAVMTLDAQSPDFKNKVDSVHALGNADIRAAAGVSNRMLERPVAALDDGLFGDKAPIARSLTDLRTTVEDLDPSRQGDLSPRKLLGMLPFGNRAQGYFMKYRSAQNHINAILESLYRGQDELRRDNAAIEQEKVNLWTTMQRLQGYVYLGKKVDAALSEKVGELEQRDPEKARIVKEEMLFYTRQKVTDLLTQLAVSIQGYLALDLVRKNNLELIKGVDRATTTTVSALRTAVMVAQALTNQKLVLDQITALNTTTGNLIESTSAMLRDQSKGVYENASSASVDLEQLEKAFVNTYAALDMISDYKVQALGTMQKTVDTLFGELERAETYLDRVRREEIAPVTDSLSLPPGESGL